MFHSLFCLELCCSYGNLRCLPTSVSNRFSVGIESWLLHRKPQPAETSADPSASLLCANPFRRLPRHMSFIGCLSLQDLLLRIAFHITPLFSVGKAWPL